MPAFVFLSHSSKNDATVTKIHDEIEAATHEDVWVDHRDLIAGDEWQPKIDGALAKCTHMLVILSKESVVSPEVTAEWRDALLRKKPLLPVIIDDVALEAIPSRLRIIQPVNLATDWAGGIKQLVDVIGRAHKGESAAKDFGYWPVTGMIERLLVSIPISGREKDIETVQRYLKQAPTSILGVGGLGKSRLAAEIVLTQADTSGAVWHVCGEYTTAEDVYGLLREHLGLEATTSADEVLKRLRAEQVLVVLDNAELIGETEARRKDYVKLVNDLHATKGVQVLLTSRTEWEDIKAGKLHKLNEPEVAAAEQIVRDMAKFNEITEYKADDYAPALAKAARYHPRLIEWAVGKLAKFEPDNVINELNELESENEDIQAVLDEMIRQTVMQMMAAEDSMPEAALRRLVVCRGGFTYQAAGYLLQAQKKGLVARDYVNVEAPLELLNKNLLKKTLDVLQGWQFVRRVVTEKGKTRYTIEPLVIAAVQADKTAYQPHYDYYKALAWQHDERQDYLGLAVESDNLEVAFEWAMNAQEYEQVYWIYAASQNFLRNRGRFSQRMNWLSRVAAELKNHSNKDMFANAQIDLGLVYSEHPLGNRTENLKLSIEASKEALQWYTEARNTNHYAIAQNNLGNAYRSLSEIEDRKANLKRSVGAYEAALRYFTPKSAPLKYALVQNNLGTAYSDLAEMEEREENLRQAVGAFEAALVYRTAEAAPLAYATTQMNLAGTYWQLARIEDNTKNLRLALTASENAGRLHTPDTEPLGYAKVKHIAGMIQEDLGDLDNAIECWREAEIYYRQMQHVETADMMLEWISDTEKRLQKTRKKRKG